VRRVSKAQFPTADVKNAFHTPGKSPQASEPQFIPHGQQFTSSSLPNINQDFIANPKWHGLCYESTLLGLPEWVAISITCHNPKHIMNRPTVAFKPLRNIKLVTLAGKACLPRT
jgi:DNA/RNA endonuclease G (NUC1)